MKWKIGDEVVCTKNGEKGVITGFDESNRYAFIKHERLGRCVWECDYLTSAKEFMEAE